MEIFGMVMAVLLFAGGFVCCFIPKVPGPAIAWLGLVIGNYSIDAGVAWWLLWLIMPVLIIGSMIFISKFAPGLAAKVHEFGKQSKLGTLLGSLIAVTFLLAGCGWVWFLALLLTMTYGFAFLFEFLKTKNPEESVFRALGGYVLFCASTLINIILVFVCLILTFDNLLS